MAVSLLEARRQILLNTPHIESASGSIATFNTDLSANLKECKIHFLPVQEGSGDPSPDNVRPITGWDGVTVIKTGKNLANLNESEMLSYGWTKAFPNPFRKPGKYTISCQNTIVTGSQSGSFVFLGNAVTDSSGYVLTGWTFGNSVMSVSFNINAGALEKKYIVFRFNAPPNYASLSNAQIQIEEGLEATEYEIPPLEIPISFGQTIYGGYVDLVRGEVVETHIVYEIGGLTWAKDRVLNTTFSNTFSDMQQLPFDFDGNIYCTTYNPKMSSPLSQIRLNIADGEIWGRSNYQSLFIKDNRFSDAESFKGANNGQFIIVPIATPIHHQLTPQAIKALKGINNIWSNANGDIEVKFWKH